MPNRRWAASETVGDALDSQGSEQHYRPSLQHHEQSVGRLLGASDSGMKTVPTNLSHTQLLAFRRREDYNLLLCDVIK